MPELPSVLNVLVFYPDPKVHARIKAIAPDRLNVVDVSREFAQEIAAEWPGGRYARMAETAPSGELTDEERDRLVREAHVILLSMPLPRSWPKRAQQLIWAHLPFAGVSNVLNTDWWGYKGAMISSSRAATNVIPIAETVIGALLMFAKRLDIAAQNTIAGKYDIKVGTGMLLVQGKKLAVVGLGGIGGEVARLGRGLGLRVVGSRRSAQQRQADVEGVDMVYPPSELKEMVADADFVLLSLPWTPDTQHVIDAEVLAAMKPGAYLFNVARGEVIDEPALIAALRSGHLGGAYLDVWTNETAGVPDPELLAAPNLVFTPHISNRSDISHAFAVDVFCRNLEHLLQGEPLENLVDWSRGY